MAKPDFVIRVDKLDEMTGRGTFSATGTNDYGDGDVSFTVSCSGIIDPSDVEQSVIDAILPVLLADYNEKVAEHKPTPMELLIEKTLKDELEKEADE